MISHISAGGVPNPNSSPYTPVCPSRPCQIPSLAALALQVVAYQSEIVKNETSHGLLQGFFQKEFTRDLCTWSFLFDKFEVQDSLLFFHLLFCRFSGKPITPQDKQFKLNPLIELDEEEESLLSELHRIINGSSECKTERDRLECAAKLGFEQVVERLMNRFDAVELEGALLLSDAENRSTVIPILVERGANFFNRTPLHHAARRGDMKKVEALLATKVDVDARDDRGKTPFYLAAEFGYPRIMKKLLAHGANREVLDEELINPNGEIQPKTYPLHFVAAKGNVGGVQILIQDLKYSIHEKDSKGFTPIFWAASGGQVEIIKLLKDLGADIDSQLNGCTPLMIAAAEDKPETIRELVRLGAKLETVTEYGTALHVAADYDATDINLGSFKCRNKYRYSSWVQKNRSSLCYTRKK